MSQQLSFVTWDVGGSDDELEFMNYVTRHCNHPLLISVLALLCTIRAPKKMAAILTGDWSLDDDTDKY